MQRSDFEGGPVAVAPWLLNQVLVRGECAGRGAVDKSGASGAIAVG